MEIRESIAAEAHGAEVLSGKGVPRRANSSRGNCRNGHCGRQKWRLPSFPLPITGYFVEAGRLHHVLRYTGQLRDAIGTQYPGDEGAVVSMICMPSCRTMAISMILVREAHWSGGFQVDDGVSAS